MTLLLILTSLRKYRRWVFRGALVLLVVMGGIIWKNLHHTAHITQVDPIRKVVELPVEKITEKEVIKYVPVQDRAAVAELLRQNKKLNTEVEQLTLALAQHTSSGSGVIQYGPILPGSTSTGTVYRPFKFNDYRLHLISLDGVNATYTLDQKFSILTSVGHNEQHLPVNFVDVYEIDDKGERHKLLTSEITTIIPKQSGSSFYVQPTLQAGIGILPGTTTATDKSPTAFVVAVPWLKRGKSRVVEQTRYAYLSPAVSVNGDTPVVGIMPVSINTGTFKYTPFSDIWISPFGGVNTKTNKKELGIFVTATF